MEVMRAEPQCKGCLSTTLVLLFTAMVVVEVEEEAKSNVYQAQI